MCRHTATVAVDWTSTGGIWAVLNSFVTHRDTCAGPTLSAERPGAASVTRVQLADGKGYWSGEVVVELGGRKGERRQEWRRRHRHLRRSNKRILTCGILTASPESPSRTGLVCSNGFDAKDAAVVCRELGLAGGAVAFFGLPKVPLPYVVTGMECAGTEPRLAACQFSLASACAWPGRPAGVGMPQ